MKKILILGSTGKLGNVLTKTLLENGYSINALVRNPGKVKVKNDNLKIFSGSVTDENELSNALKDVSIVISVLGHGFRTNYPIQEKTMKILIPLMEKKKIRRLITISGAGLKTKDDPKSLILETTSKLFKLIDPYRINDAKKQQDLIENSNLDWTVVRTPIHSEKGKKTITYSGYAQPMPWIKISRTAISNFMIELIEKDIWIKKSPIIY